jgi:hypothetical protein
MARINKKQTIKRMEGLGSVDPRSAVMAQGGDDVAAFIQPAQAGQAPTPAALKEGEIVFSIPSIIGAGEGDYDAGAEVILALHERLKALGEQMLEENSLASEGNQYE